MRRAVTGCLMLVCVVALLADQAEGHIAFFSPKEMRELREKEGRKDADPRAEGVLIEETSLDEDGGESAGQPVEIGLKLTAKKGHIGSAFGKMLQSIVEEPETAK
ncbi:motilin-like [Puntigrus tetrazona]|uniref:motilin-like n=1 Tax=Puntigrus tetrazona TaxID=1606681 RepID=UPI001C8A0881|nr:motilin-like [Puntigrus tetrazona]XP_043077024.1 motilin-like [Puntigrus tetrazona]